MGFNLWLLKSTLSHVMTSSKSGDPRDVKIIIIWAFLLGMLREEEMKG